MKSCSQIIKLCGLKSTKQVADLNQITPRWVQVAFKKEPKKFSEYVLHALLIKSDSENKLANNILNKFITP